LGVRTELHNTLFFKYLRWVSSNVTSFLGWSFGGLLSLEIAHVLAHDPDLHVIGIIMIDSVNPKAPHNGNHSITKYELSFNDRTPPETKRLVAQSVAHLRDIIDAWQLPSWQVDETSTDVEKVPPTIVLRARQYVFDKNRNKDSATAIYDIDIARHEARLGWDYYNPSFINQVFDIPGHHYSIFDNDKV
jgi:thioesterase domain-containing protein